MLQNQWNILGFVDGKIGGDVIGNDEPVAAVAMGASVIERHFTLDRNMDGPDHKASLEPDELAAMVKAIRNVETALGNGEKTGISPMKWNEIIGTKAKRDFAEDEMIEI